MSCRRKSIHRFFYLVLVLSLFAFLLSFFLTGVNHNKLKQNVYLHYTEQNPLVQVTLNNDQKAIAYKQRNNIALLVLGKHGDVQELAATPRKISDSLRDTSPQDVAANTFERYKEFGRKVYIPYAYHKDFNALEKFMAYHSKTEKALPLQTRAVILLTNYRSGSSFFGELLNQHRDVFYVFEPLITFSSTEKCSNVDLKKQVIAQLSQCIIPDWQSIYAGIPADTRPAMNRNIFVCTRKRFCFSPFTKELIDEEHCPRSNLNNHVHDPWSDCGAINLNITANICRRKKLVAMKVIRFCDIMDLEEIVTKLHVDLKVVHLVRDPRGIASSRSYLHRRLLLYKSLNVTCGRQANNAKAGLFTKPKWLEGRYKMFRYEDAAENPIQTAEELYKFIGLEFDNSVKDWIMNNTAVNISADAESFDKQPIQHYGNGEKVVFTKRRYPMHHIVRRDVPAMEDPWGHTRNAKSIIEKWPKHLYYIQVKRVEAVCQGIMKIAGYLPVNGFEEYENKTRRYFVKNYLDRYSVV